MTSVSEPLQLLRAGRLAEAERAYERLLEQSPNDLQALNMVALAALRTGRPKRALDLLERALKVDSQDAPTQFHLARAHEACGNLAAALAAYADALRLKPDFHLARLHRAAALERAGDPRGALVNFARALKEAQHEGRWTNSATTPQSLRPLVEHAARKVRSGRHELFFGLLEPLAQRYGRAALARVERCLRIHLVEEPVEYADPRQQPTFLYFPGPPASAYPDRSLFPWIADLEARTAVIRDELLGVLGSEAGRERVFTSDELEQQNLRGLAEPPSWTGYYFYRHGERREGNCSSCPQTVRALEALPLARVPAHAPEVLFSVFTPGTQLLPHRGVTNTRLVGHLPLIVPENCALSVGGEVHEWQQGRVVVFDDTYEHEAWNRSDRTRVVLIFDLWHPALSAAEREAVSALVVALGDFRVAMEQA
ncbi:MAG TPA: aspartyl/asparaginyl beta-hydroxylase domain-containing protein [Steroidobacteraceae bacterium]|nr:aspartyl/asparaginyl beta-hydroxylase domain-containing protein [Steroidobacteraceae bacterium]